MREAVLGHRESRPLDTVGSADMEQFTLKSGTHVLGRSKCVSLKSWVVAPQMGMGGY